MELRSQTKRKRLKDEIEGQSNKTKKLEEERPPEVEPVDEPKPPILMTPYDALELVFDYISLYDLCQVGLTCKRLQHVAGTYFRLYYPQVPVMIKGTSESVEQYLSEISEISVIYTTNLACYAKRIVIQNYADLNNNKLIRYVAQLKMKYLIKRIDFVGFTRFSANQAQCLAEVLKNVETLQFRGNCSGIAKILSFCSNLKILKFVGDSDCYWPQQNNPKLEQLQCDILPKDKLNKIQFAKKNPQIKKIAYTNYNNRIQPIGDLMDFVEQAEMRLDELTICCEALSKDKMDRLNDLQARGYYKQLRMICGSDNQDFIDNLKLIKSLNALEMPHHYYFGTKLMEALVEMPSVCKLKIHFYSRHIKTHTESLVNLDELIFDCCSLEGVVQLVRNLPKLKKIRACGMNVALNVHQLNEERTKLPNANKLTIYLNGDAFLETRWASIDLDYELVGVRRLKEDFGSL